MLLLFAAQHLGTSAEHSHCLKWALQGCLSIGGCQITHDQIGLSPIVWCTGRGCFL